MLAEQQTANKYLSAFVLPCFLGYRQTSSILSLEIVIVLVSTLALTILQTVISMICPSDFLMFQITCNSARNNLSHGLCESPDLTRQQ